MVTVVSLASFNPTNGQYPLGPLIEDASGNLYGTTQSGGPYSAGTIFEIVKTATGYASTATTIATFNGTNGSSVGGGLYMDAAGNLYGTTFYAGLGYGSGSGTIFELVKTAAGYAGTPTTLATFNGTDGTQPNGNLIADSAGNLYGLTASGGTANDGVMYEIQKTANGYSSTPTVIANFSGTDGKDPVGKLTTDSAGDLFGVTYMGGTKSFGTVFEIAKTATGYASAPTDLYNFFGADGGYPTGNLVLDANGDIFGVSNIGGASGRGGIFEIQKSATGYAGTPLQLASFSITSGLTIDAAGDLFGTGSNGSTAAMFELVKTATGYAATPTFLTNFATAQGTPNSGLFTDPAGNMFVTTGTGGSYGSGTVAEIVHSGGTYASTPISLASFGGTLSGTTSAAGSYPTQGLVEDAAGDLFGLTSYGGINGAGAIFEIAKTSGGYATTPTTLVNLTSQLQQILVDSAGDLFTMSQTTQISSSGAYSFSLTTNEYVKTASGYSSTPTSLAPIPAQGGVANPFIDSAGNVFAFGLTNNTATVNLYEIAKTGSAYATTPVLLATLDSAIAGTTPIGTLTEDGAGNLFGVTDGYNGNPVSIVFEIAKTATGYASTETVLAKFNAAVLSQTILSLDSAGNLFGVTYSGGANFDGTIFEIAKTASGYSPTVTTLYSFSGTDGKTPQGQVLIDGAGNLYGITSTGGANGDGIVFELAKTNTGYANAITTLKSFSGTDGALPNAALVADSAGDLLGTVYTGGINGGGAVFEISGAGYVVTASAAASDVQSTLLTPLAVADSGADIAANLDALQTLASAGKLASLTLTDSGVATLSITAAQATNDAAALKAISGYFTLSETAPAASSSITGSAGALGNTLDFSGTASQYTITPNAAHTGFTISGNGVTDVVSGIQALQFGNATLFIAQNPGTNNAPTTGNITELYAAVFGRLPDVAGLAYYQNQLAANPTTALTTFAQQFLSSPEYQNNAAHNYAQTTAGDTQFIGDLYTNLLHRTPAAGDAAWYEANVIAGVVGNATPGTAAYTSALALAHAIVVTDFSQSAEFLQNVQVTATTPASNQHWLVLI